MFYKTLFKGVKTYPKEDVLTFCTKHVVTLNKFFTILFPIKPFIYKNVTFKVIDNYNKIFVTRAEYLIRYGNFEVYYSSLEESESALAAIKKIKLY